MCPYLTSRDLVDSQTAEREEREAKVKTLEGESQRFLEHVQKSPATQQQKQLLKSLAERMVNDKNPEVLRDRLKEPPKGLRWGGLIAVDRDRLYCNCGCLVEDHGTEKHPHWCACKKTASEFSNDFKSNVGEFRGEGDDELDFNQRTQRRNK